MRRLLMFFSIPAHERRLVVVALPIVVIARLGLWLLPLHLLRDMLCWLADTTAATRAHSDYAGRAALAVQRASRLVPGATCLTQTLATLTLMRRRGLIGRLCIDSQHDSKGAYPTHARVELGGHVIIGGSLVRCSPRASSTPWLSWLSSA